jgi:hypothetical protein
MLVRPSFSPAIDQSLVKEERKKKKREREREREREKKNEVV